MMKTRKGMSLAEILIGFLIIMSAAVIFFQTMHRFRKESTFNSENFLASSLIEKVLEQCYQESELNLHGLQAIGLTDADGKPYAISGGITDKQAVFFLNPAITKDETPDLHHVLKDNFNLVINTEKKDGFYELTAGFKWNAESGKGQAFSSTRILSFTGEKEVVTTFALSDASVKERLVKDIFNAPGAALSTKVSSIGAQEMLVHLGHVYYSTLDWLNSDDFKTRRQKAKSLEIFTQPDSADFEKCSNLYFELARDQLHIMVSLKMHLEGLNANLNFLDSIPLPDRFIVESRIEKAGLYYRQLRRLFMNCILKVSERYEQQLQHAKTQRLQRQMLARLFNINRILYVNREFSEEVSPSQVTARVEKFLDAAQTAFKDKDASVTRMIDQERAFIEQNRLKENFFLPRLTNDLFKEVDKFITVLDEPQQLP